MRQEVARLVHQVDAQLVVLDADVHVHAADDEAPADAGKVAGDRLVAVAVGRLLRAPAREGVRGGGDRGEPMLSCELGHGGSEIGQFPPCIPRRIMHARADLDLRFEELARHLTLQGLLRGIEQGLRHLARQVPARLVDEQVFLLDADGERRILERHDSHGGIERGGVQTACRATATSPVVSLRALGLVPRVEPRLVCAARPPTTSGLRCSLRRLIQRGAEAAHGQCHRQQHEARQRQRFKLQIVEVGALEHDAACDADVVRQGQHFAHHLRPAGHARVREHEAREQDVGQEEHEGHLDRLQLVLGNRRKCVADRQVGGDEERAERRQQQDAALDGHVEEEDGK